MFSQTSFSKNSMRFIFLIATIYTILLYGLKLSKVYNGEFAISFTGMDAFVTELLSFFMTAIVIGFILLRNPQEKFGKQLLQISSIIIFSGVMVWLMLVSSNSEILNFTFVSIIIASTIIKVQIAHNYRYRLLNLLVYPFFLIICFLITDKVFMLNESLSQHLLSINMYDNPLEAHLIFTDTLWALFYYISIGIFLPIFHMFQKSYTQIKIR